MHVDIVTLDRTGRDTGFIPIPRASKDPRQGDEGKRESAKTFNAPSREIKGLRAFLFSHGLILEIIRIKDQVISWLQKG